MEEQDQLKLEKEYRDRWWQVYCVILRHFYEVGIPANKIASIAKEKTQKIINTSQPFHEDSPTEKSE